MGSRDVTTICDCLSTIFFAHLGGLFNFVFRLLDRSQ